MQLMKLQIASLKRLHIFPIVLFLLPFYAGKPYFPGVTSVVPVTIFSVIFIGIYLYYAWKRKSFSAYMGVPSVLLIGIYIISASLSVNLFQSRQSIYLLLAGLAVFQISAALSVDKFARHQLMEAIGYSASFLSIYAILFSFNIGMRSGLYATFYNYNAFAGYLALSALALPALAFSTSDSRSDIGLFYPLLGFLTIYLVWIRSIAYEGLIVWAFLSGLMALSVYILLRRASPRMRYMLFFLPVPVALAMTGSRGGLLSFMAAVAVALVIIYLKEPTIRKVVVWLAVAMVAFIVVLISSQPGLAERFALFFKPSNRSDLYRCLAWKGTWKAFISRPFLGHGPGTFASIYPVYKAGGVDTLMAHNSYLQLLAETGATGLAVLIAFMIASLTGLYTCLKNSVQLSAIAAVLSAGIVAMAIHNAVDYTWYIPSHQILFMAILGSLSALRLDITDTNPLQFKSLPNRVSGAAMALLTALSAIAALVWSMPAAIKYDKGIADLNNGWRSYAETEIARAVAGDSWSGAYIVALADICSYDADSNYDAVKLYRQAIALERINPYYRLRLAKHLMHKGDYDEAITEARKALKLSPALRAGWRLIGDAEAMKKQYAEAIRAYKRVLHISYMPYESEKYLPLGELLPRTEEGKALLGLGHIYIQQGKQSEARNSLAEARRIFSRYVESVEKNPILFNKRREAEEYKGIILSIDELLRRKL